MAIEERLGHLIHRSKTEVNRNQSQLPDAAVHAALESWLGDNPDVSQVWYQVLWYEMRLAINKALDVILPTSTASGILAAIDKRIQDTGGLQDNSVILKFSELEVLRLILGRMESGKPLGYARLSQIVRISQEGGTTLSVTDEPCGYCVVPIHAVSQPSAPGVVSDAMVEAIDKRFRSGNSVPVERAHITATEWAVLRARVAQSSADDAPIPMLLFCPQCSMQHIDAPEDADCDGEVVQSFGWDNPPHRSHLCADLAIQIATELARIDGYEPEDPDDALYAMRWGYRPNPEPDGDRWSIDYLPKGERIAKSITPHPADARDAEMAGAHALLSTRGVQTDNHDTGADLTLPERIECLIAAHDAAVTDLIDDLSEARAGNTDDAQVIAENNFPETDGWVRRQFLADAPIQMLLFCPTCATQHIDAPDPPRKAVGERRGPDGRWEKFEYDAVPEWNNPPHRSHLCAKCGWIWRPADVATTGVAKLQTQGEKDESAVPAEHTFKNNVFKLRRTLNTIRLHLQRNDHTDPFEGRKLTDQILDHIKRVLDETSQEDS